MDRLTSRSTPQEFVKCLSWCWVGSERFVKICWRLRQCPKQSSDVPVGAKKGSSYIPVGAPNFSALSVNAERKYSYDYPAWREDHPLGTLEIFCRPSRCWSRIFCWPSWRPKKSQSAPKACSLPTSLLRLQPFYRRHSRRRTRSWNISRESSIEPDSSLKFFLTSQSKPQAIFRLPSWCHKESFDVPVGAEQITSAEHILNIHTNLKIPCNIFHWAHH